MVNVYHRGMKVIAVSGWERFNEGPEETAGSVPLAHMLVSASYVFDATHNNVSDVSAWELSSTSYLANGSGSTHVEGGGRPFALALSTVEVDASGFAAVDASDVAWYNMTDSEDIGAVITFVSAFPEGGSVGAGTVSSNHLLFHHDVNAGVVNGDLTVRWNNASGMAAFTSGC